MANIFFASILVLYGFTVAATNAWSNLGPLLVLLTMTMTKDGVEDILRHHRDRRLNHRLVKILKVDSAGTNLHWVVKRAMDVRVGDVICCEREEAFPCDVIILASSNTSGVINLTTANLDGETNVKRFYAVSSTQPHYIKVAPDGLNRHVRHCPNTPLEVIKPLYVRVECEQPTADLTKFEGRLSTKFVQDIPLIASNLALRGARLRNTDFMLGLVVYTGADTKLSLNGKQAKRKCSTRSSKSNTIILLFIISMVLLSVSFAITFTFWTRVSKDTMWHIPTSPETRWEFVLSVFRFVFILSCLIPISIVITIELQQLIMAYLISQDLKMYLPSEDLCAKANSAQMADELGQVEFLFSDKTGTLTRNSLCMRLYGLLESGIVYTFPSLNADVNRKFARVRVSDELQLSKDPNTPPERHQHICEETVKMDQNYPDESDCILMDYLTMSVLCHTVTCAHTADENVDAAGVVLRRRIPAYEVSRPLNRKTWSCTLQICT
ncbi:putative phospholipid-transporting ATPase IF [Clonorchis sinensis]|uniref:Phospholipid-transporting ATPase IF n=1 Tax=Clonorchis sinensis TaxID=79923 RepID=A0A8T1LXA3_CLOSI|nr:putative phospholipid-transporting ATPase IF [Clonorchis sinensis]